jgi:hypothetical protein
MARPRAPGRSCRCTASVPRSPREADSASRSDGGLDRTLVTRHCPRGDDVLQNTYPPDAKTGKVTAVGNTVEANTATSTNTIGAAQLSGEWVDPDFDPAVSAACYARAIQIPSPHWTT